MATRKTGISHSLLIPPGETVADILEDRSITQEELASKMGIPPQSVEELIHGKEDISETLASGLERALNIPRSFWLNLQANYERELSDLSMETASIHSPKHSPAKKQRHLPKEFTFATGRASLTGGGLG